MRTTIEKIINPLYIMAFFLVSIFMVYYHESFSDEAQSYLIARDASILDIIKNVARTEGSPLLWYIWLKLCIGLGINFKYISLTSAIPNLIGVYLFIKKAPFPPVVRYLFPLTYFIFYQYNIIARNYSLIFLFIILAAIYFNKRQSNGGLYLIILMLLGQINVYTFILASCILVLGIYEDLQQKKYNFKIMIAYALYAIATVALLFPNTDNEYFTFISSGMLQIATNIVGVVTCGLINFNTEDAVFLGIGAIYFILTFIELLNSYRRETIFLLIPMLIFECYAYKYWHGGIIILTCMLIFWLNSEKKLNKELKFFIVIIFTVQIAWSVEALIKDKKSLYSAGETAYNFLNEQNIDISRVAFLQFNSTSVCPYAKSKKCTYWDWNDNLYSKIYWDKDKYDAYMINTHRYVDNIQAWEDFQKQDNLSLKIIKTQHFIATKNISQDEDVYIYYKKIEDR